MVDARSVHAGFSLSGREFLLPRGEFGTFSGVLISHMRRPHSESADLLRFLRVCQLDHDRIYSLDSLPAPAFDHVRSMAEEATVSIRKVVVMLRRGTRQERLHDMEQLLVELTDFLEFLGKTEAATPEVSGD